MRGKGLRRNPKGDGGGGGKGPGQRRGFTPQDQSGPGGGPGGCAPKYKGKDEDIDYK